MAFALGTIQKMRPGDVSTLNWIKPGFERETEAALGFQPGRLREGYWIAFLQTQLQPDDFRFAGTTLRSGGRMGLPKSTAAEDAARAHVSDVMRDEYGLDAVTAMQAGALKRVELVGMKRITKVFANIKHDDAIPPDVQYPAGGGGLQWTVTRSDCELLFAVRVHPDGRAETPEFTVHPRSDGYEARARLRRFMTSYTG